MMERVPATLAKYVGKVRDHAYKVIEADVAGMRMAGFSDDEVFELTVATALGVGLFRLDAVVRAIEQEV